MYTITIFALSLISLLLVFLFRKKLNFKKLFFIVPILTVASWIQFIYFNNASDICAWTFSPEHILGVKFLNTALEDYLFAIVLSIILFVVHRLMDKRINRKSSDFSKVMSFTVLFCITFFFYLFSGEFGQKQIFYMVFGLLCIWRHYKDWDVTQFWVIFSINFLIAGGWDVWANNCEIQQWFYRHVITLDYSSVFKTDSWWWFKIGKGWFPLSIFPQYYISGSMFCQGVILITNKIFKQRSYNEYQISRHFRR